MQPRKFLTFFAAGFLMQPFVVGAVVLTVGLQNGRAGDGRAVLLMFVPVLFVFSTSFIGWMMFISDAKANSTLSSTEQAEWLTRLRANPYASLIYWWRVVRLRGRQQP
jgi:hypothetical protein